MIGQIFGRLTVIGYRNGRTNVYCRCACRNYHIAAAWNVRRGATKSCGCLEKESRFKRNHSVHGETKDKRTPEYMAWGRMKSRCSNPKHPMWQHYGGRGISVCAEWLSDFPAFLAHVGRRPTAKHSLGRINNMANYEPGNVRWESPEEQQNNRRNNKLIEINGAVKTAAQWTRTLGITRKKVLVHYDRGPS